MASPRSSVQPQFQALRWRLLLSSLGVIGLTLLIFGVVVYEVVAYNLNRKVASQLQVLADAAAHSLTDIQANREAIHNRTSRTLDQDGDLDIPWQDLYQEQQSVEWFDAQGQLLGQAGQTLPTIAFNPTALTTPGTVQAASEIDDLQTLMLPVYDGHQPTVLRGYVRVSESTEPIEEELERLQLGLQWGGILALLLSALGGWWLMRQSLEPIERSFQQLQQFTADASHELRNPLTAIKTSVQVLQDDPERFQAADLQKLSAIASATTQMSQLVEDLLLLARTDGNVVSSVPYPSIPIDELLEEVVDQYAILAAQKQMTLKTHLAAQALVRADVHHLKRLFANLLTNALHYTLPGGTVTLSSQARDHRVLVRVEDTGVGIAPEHLPLIFDRFWRADQARSWRQGGSGLGLTIAQGIARRYQGEITVSSQLGVGSCFQVHLPEARS